MFYYFNNLLLIVDTFASTVDTTRSVAGSAFDKGASEIPYLVQ